MATYRRKPIEIEAHKISELLLHARDNRSLLPSWVQEGIEDDTLVFYKDHILITTLEGVMTGNRDSYLVKGVKGEMWAIKPDIFEQTYEQVKVLEIELDDHFAYAYVTTGRKAWHLDNVFASWEEFEFYRDDYTDNYIFRKPKGILTDQDNKLLEQYG